MSSLKMSIRIDDADDIVQFKEDDIAENVQFSLRTRVRIVETVENEVFKEHYVEKV